MRITKQTPPIVREWLSPTMAAFPLTWTLDQVAEESRRRYLSKRWTSELEAVRCVTHWAGCRLAISRDFSADSWEWIVGDGPFAPRNHYARLVTILEPAYAQGPVWRTTEAERKQFLKRVGEMAGELLRILETERRLDVTMREVAGYCPEMQPLVDLEFQAIQERSKGLHAYRSRLGDAERSAEESRFGDFVAGPRLSDYLAALLGKILGDRRQALPSDLASLPLLDDDSGSEVAESTLAEEALRIAGLLPPPAQPFEPDLLRPGGEFGAYPSRATALRAAVIQAFPRALFDRLVEPPPSTPASVIEAACLAWFESSPSQKEINGLIKVERSMLEPAMVRGVAEQAAMQARRTAWRNAGLTEDEIQIQEFRSFLEDE